MYPQFEKANTYSVGISMLSSAKIMRSSFHKFRVLLSIWNLELYNFVSSLFILESPLSKSKLHFKTYVEES